MRISLLTLIAIVTVAGLLVSLFYGHYELRQIQSQIATTSAQNFAAADATANHQKALAELDPYLIRAEKTLDIREDVVSQVERVFAGLVAEESKIVPVEGKISIREIPAIKRLTAYRNGYAIFLPDSKRCELVLDLDDEHSLFDGFESGTRFPLATGLNKVVFTESSESSTGNVAELVLMINDNVVAKAVAQCDGGGSGHGYGDQSLITQKDYSSMSKKLRLIGYQRHMTFTDGTKVRPQFKLNLVEVSK